MMNTVLVNTVLASSVSWGQLTIIQGTPKTHVKGDEQLMKRMHEVKLRLNDSEFETINDYVSKTGYTSREKYMRAVLMNNVPKEQRKRQITYTLKTPLFSL